MMTTDRVLRLARQVEKEASPTAVHHLRTSIRRLEATLPGGVEAAPKLRKHLRRLRRGAGAVRDLDVQIELLRQLHLDRDSGRRELLQGMEAERERLARKLGVHVTPGRRRKLAKRLRQALRQASPAPAPQDRMRQVREGFAAVDRRFAGLSPANLHDFRKACKRLRYQAEVAEPAVEAALLVDQFRQIQDGVGAWHDWTELALRARAEQAAQDSPLRAALDNAAAVALGQALRTAQQIRARLRAHWELSERRPPASVRPALAARALGRATA